MKAKGLSHSRLTDDSSFLLIIQDIAIYIRSKLFLETPLVGCLGKRFFASF